MVVRGVMNLAGISSWWAWRRYEWKRRHVYVCKSKDVIVNFSLIAPYSVIHFLWSYFHISFAFKWLWSVKIGLLKFLDPKVCQWIHMLVASIIIYCFISSFLPDSGVCTRPRMSISDDLLIFSPFGSLYGWFCLISFYLIWLLPIIVVLLWIFARVERRRRDRMSER